MCGQRKKSVSDYPLFLFVRRIYLPLHSRFVYTNCTHAAGDYKKNDVQTGNQIKICDLKIQIFITKNFTSFIYLWVLFFHQNNYQQKKWFKFKIQSKKSSILTRLLSFPSHTVVSSQIRISCNSLFLSIFGINNPFLIQIIAYCIKAKNLLKQLGVEFFAIELDNDRKSSYMRLELRLYYETDPF